LNSSSMRDGRPTAIDLSLVCTAGSAALTTVVLRGSSFLVAILAGIPYLFLLEPIQSAYVAAAATAGFYWVVHRYMKGRSEHSSVGRGAACWQPT
jgi:hypothetical protein